MKPAMKQQQNANTTTQGSNGMFEVNAELKQRGITPLVYEQLKAALPKIGNDQTHILLQVWDYAKARNLDIFAGHVFADTRLTNGVPQLRVMTTIAGYRAIAHASGEYAGMDQPKYGPTKTFQSQNKKQSLEAPEWVEVTVYRITNGHRYPVTAREFFSENVEMTNSGHFGPIWRGRPIGQLTVRAESQAFRKAFSGCDAYTPEEIAFGDTIIDHGDNDSHANLTSILEGYANAGCPEDVTAVSATVDTANLSKEDMERVMAAYNSAVARLKEVQHPSEAVQVDPEKALLANVTEHYRNAQNIDDLNNLATWIRDQWPTPTEHFISEVTGLHNAALARIESTMQLMNLG